ncbi:hypothetical protein WDU94_008915 [Cyamophila willieti]
MLGFVTRSTKNFPDVLSLKILYCSLVRSSLEFASCVWSPLYNYHSSRIERIQHKALITMGRRSKSSDLSYDSLQKSFNLLPLSTRREMFDILTFFNILFSNIDTPELLGSININVPKYSAPRHHLPFRPPFVRRNYLQHSPMIRLQRTANALDIDLFSSTDNSIRNFYHCLL